MRTCMSDDTKEKTTNIHFKTEQNTCNSNNNNNQEKEQPTTAGVRTVCGKMNPMLSGDPNGSDSGAGSEMLDEGALLDCLL